MSSSTKTAQMINCNFAHTFLTDCTSDCFFLIQGSIKLFKNDSRVFLMKIIAKPISKVAYHGLETNINFHSVSSKTALNNIFLAVYLT